MEKLKTFDVDLKRLFFEVLKRLWLILLVGIICGASVFVYAKFFITQQYKATATIYIQNYTGDNDKKIYSSDLCASQNLVTTYQGLFTSDNVLNKVKEKLGDNYSADAYVRLLPPRLLRIRPYSKYLSAIMTPSRPQR